MKVPRVYIDTSVVGGCLDEEFAAESRALLEMGARGEIELLLSALLLAELERAPTRVREQFVSLVGEAGTAVSISPQAEDLQRAYLDRAVLGSAAANDALHVALATVARADVIVSWNFKHLVRLERIRAFNAVNLLEGYGHIEIRSPKELV